jgi:acyl carrier protein
MMAIRAAVEEIIAQVAVEQKKTMPPLRDNLHLVDCGLDSLSLAVVVARLEEALGVDPFSASEDWIFPVTLGDFIQLYENAAK